jgi:hypothetical protein
MLKIPWTLFFRRYFVEELIGFKVEWRPKPMHHVRCEIRFNMSVTYSKGSEFRDLSWE